MYNQASDLDPSCGVYPSNRWSPGHPLTTSPPQRCLPPGPGGLEGRAGGSTSRHRPTGALLSLQLCDRVPSLAWRGAGAGWARLPWLWGRRGRPPGTSQACVSMWSGSRKFKTNCFRSILVGPYSNNSILSEVPAPAAGQAASWRCWGRRRKPGLCLVRCRESRRRGPMQSLLCWCPGGSSLPSPAAPGARTAGISPRGGWRRLRSAERPGWCSPRVSSDWRSGVWRGSTSCSCSARTLGMWRRCTSGGCSATTRSSGRRRRRYSSAPPAPAQVWRALLRLDPDHEEARLGLRRGQR